jgi:mannitol/fructose-specific phosphotransferase system IIA component (Ntr-type)
MTLSDLIRADRVVVPLRGGTLAEAGHVLLDRLVATGAIASPARLSQRADEARPEDLVAMGDRAFLLHYRSDAVADLAVALGTSAAPVSRELGESDGTQEARIVLFVVAPPRMAAQYLQAVGALARLLSRDEVVDAVVHARDAAAVAALPAFAEIELRDQLAVRDLMTERPRSVAPTRRCATPRSTWCAPASRGSRSSRRRPRGRDALAARALAAPPDEVSCPRRRPGRPAARRAAPPGARRDDAPGAVRQPRPARRRGRRDDVQQGRRPRAGRERRALVGFLTRGDIVRKLIGS